MTRPHGDGLDKWAAAVDVLAHRLRVRNLEATGLAVLAVTGWLWALAQYSGVTS